MPGLAASVQTPRHSPRCVFTARMTLRPRQAPKRCIDVSTQVLACVVVPRPRSVSRPNPRVWTS